MGVSPSGMHSAYLVDPSRLDVAKRKAPSTMIGVELCAAFTAAQVVKILLGRGEVKPAPFHYHFDSYLNKFEAERSPGNADTQQAMKGDAVEEMFKKQLGIG